MTKPATTEPPSDWVALARQSDEATAYWKTTPPGLSVMGFGKIGPVAGQEEALAQLQREKSARDGR